MPGNSQAREHTVGIIRTSSIGDVVLASACLDLATKIGVKIVWIGRSPTLAVLQMAYPAFKFVEMPKSLTSESLSRLKNEIGLLHAVVDLQGNMRTQAFLRQATRDGIPTFSTKKRRVDRLRLIGSARFRGRLSPKSGYDSKTPLFQYKTMLETFALCLRSLGFGKDRIEEALKASRPNLEALGVRPIAASWAKELSFGRWFALAPGAAHATKQCPKQIWIDTLLRFKERFAKSEGARLMVVGGDHDRKIAVEILDEVSWPWPVLNMAGKLSLEDSAAALSRVELLLTNDSGLLHLAEAVGTDVLAVFGPTVEEFGFGPWRKASQAVSSNIGCRPCSRHGKIECRYGDKLCFESLPMIKMINSMTEIFSKPKNVLDPSRGVVR